ARLPRGRGVPGRRRPAVPGHRPVPRRARGRDRGSAGELRRASSEASLRAAQERFDPVLSAAGAEAATIGEQLFAVVDALDGSGSLRRALTDPARPGEDKAALVGQLLEGKADGRLVALVSGLVRSRWSPEGDLADVVERLAVAAVLAAAAHAGALPTVEDELFRLDRMLTDQRELRTALSDPRAGAEARGALVEQLLGGKVDPRTLLLVRRVLAVGRGRSASRALGFLGQVVAERRSRLVATVTTGSVLSTAQTDRLGALLERAYGRPVQLNVSVDPNVLGGLRIQVGAEVVDGTVLGRLDEARRRLAG